MVSRTPTEAAEMWLRGYWYAAADDVLDSSAPRIVDRRDYLRRMEYAVRLTEPRVGRTILEIGCSAGTTMLLCGLLGATVYGVDLEASAIGNANDLLHKFGVEGEARLSDAAETPFERERFDAVLANDFTEHLTRKQKAAVLREGWRVLKPGGSLVIRTPNLAYLRLSLLAKRVRAMFRGKNPLRIIIPHTTAGDRDHIGLASRWELAKCLVDAGFPAHEFYYPPIRKLGYSPLVEYVSSELPVIRDVLCEDIVIRAFKPVAAAYFPT